MTDVTHRDALALEAGLEYIQKFSARFGLEAMKFVNSTRGKKLHLRGINAKVIKSGSVRTGDKISRLEKP